jgi:hypothetical protein
MIYPGKENIPFLMSLRGYRSAAREVLIQQLNAGHTQDGKLAPVRQTTAAAFATCLIREEVHDTFLNAIVMRLHDSIFILVCKTQQTSLMNRRQNKIVNSSVHSNRRRVPYYANRAAHSLIISKFEDGSMENHACPEFVNSSGLTSGTPVCRSAIVYVNCTRDD